MDSIFLADIAGQSAVIAGQSAAIQQLTAVIAGQSAVIAGQSAAIQQLNAALEKHEANRLTSLAPLIVPAPLIAPAPLIVPAPLIAPAPLVVPAPLIAPAPLVVPAPAPNKRERDRANEPNALAKKAKKTAAVQPPSVAEVEVEVRPSPAVAQVLAPAVPAVPAPVPAVPVLAPAATKRERELAARRENDRLKRAKKAAAETVAPPAKTLLELDEELDEESQRLAPVPPKKSNSKSKSNSKGRAAATDSHAFDPDAQLEATLALEDPDDLWW